MFLFLFVHPFYFCCRPWCYHLFLTSNSRKKEGDFVKFTLDVKWNEWTFLSQFRHSNILMFSALTFFVEFLMLRYNKKQFNEACISWSIDKHNKGLNTRMCLDIIRQCYFFQLTSARQFIYEYTSCREQATHPVFFRLEKS